MLHSLPLEYVHVSNDVPCVTLHSTLYRHLKPNQCIHAARVPKLGLLPEILISQAQVPMGGDWA